MTILIPSKNGEPFLPTCLKCIRDIYPDIHIIVSDNGYTDKSFLDIMRDKYNVDIKLNPDQRVDCWKKLAIDIDDYVFFIHDSLFVKSKKFFDDLMNLNADMNVWISMKNHRFGATSEQISEMLKFIPETQWVQPAATLNLGYFSNNFIKFITSHRLVREYYDKEITLFGPVLERLLPSFLFVEYGMTLESVIEFKNTTVTNYCSMGCIETETALKYTASNILGCDREKNVDVNALSLAIQAKHGKNL